MAEYFSAGDLRKILIILLCHQHVGAISTDFTSSPSSIINANVGDNITLTWRFSLSSSDKNNFQEACLGTRTSDGSFIKLLTVSRIGSTSTPTLPDEVASFKGRIFFLGNASFSRLAEFMLSDVQDSDNGIGFLCAIKVGTIYTFSGKSEILIDSPSTPSSNEASSSSPSESSPSSSSDQSDYIVVSVIVAVIIITAVGSTVCYFKRKANAVAPIQTEVQPAGQDNDVDR